MERLVPWARLEAAIALAAVVGVKAKDLEGELFEHLLDDGQQMRLGDCLRRGHNLPLGDAVHRVDVVQALDAVEVALVDAVDAHEAGAPIGCRRTAHANGGGPVAACLGQYHALRAVAGGLESGGAISTSGVRGHR